MSNVKTIEAIQIPEEAIENGSLVIKNKCFARLITEDRIEMVLPVISMRKLPDEPEQVKIPEPKEEIKKEEKKKTVEEELEEDDEDDDFDEEFEDDEEENEDDEDVEEEDEEEEDETDEKPQKKKTKNKFMR